MNPVPLKNLKDLRTSIRVALALTDVDAVLSAFTPQQLTLAFTRFAAPESYLLTPEWHQIYSEFLFPAIKSELIYMRQDPSAGFPSSLRLYNFLKGLETLDLGRKEP